MNILFCFEFNSFWRNSLIFIFFFYAFGRLKFCLFNCYNFSELFLQFLKKLIILYILIPDGYECDMAELNV